jgi:aldehyde dehydrogenase (NAD+)
MGRLVAQAVAAPLGRSILELGGNNGIIVTPECDMNLASQAILFGSVGTAGQRYTTTRRVIVHESIYQKLIETLVAAYKQINIEDPFEEGVLMGPLIDKKAVAEMQSALKTLTNQGGRTIYGGEILSGGIYEAGTYVSPCICEAKADMSIVSHETFAPILYLISYSTLDEAIEYHNAVPQGLSSANFTNNLREVEMFLGTRGSDCGIANVNIGTSGAEIGGAFGGEKDTGGGRETGSNAWKAYMRGQTTPINWSEEVPLAQGITFDISN